MAKNVAKLSVSKKAGLVAAIWQRPFKRNKNIKERKTISKEMGDH